MFRSGKNQIQFGTLSSCIENQIQFGAHSSCIENQAKFGTHNSYSENQIHSELISSRDKRFNYFPESGKIVKGINLWAFATLNFKLFNSERNELYTECY